MEPIHILGVKVHGVTVPQALRRISEMIEDGESHSIFTPNPEFVLDARKDAVFRDTINSADLNLPDGAGLLWASTVLSRPKSNVVWELLRAKMYAFAMVLSPDKVQKILPERVTGADMVMEISKLASDRGYKVFYLGGVEGVAQEAVSVISQLYPRLQVAGVSSGPPYESEQSVIDRIRESQADFVFLAFPQKEQARWVREVLPRLSDVTFMGVGGAFDFIVEAIPHNDPTGRYKQKRAPKWMQEANLEWLHRLFTQPWRWRRIWNATGVFFWDVLKEKIRG